MYKLYDFLPSGNGYKVRLLLPQLGIPFERIEMNILQGETRTPEFLQKNPNGRIPVLEIAPNQYLAESNAILFYLSEGTPFFPDNAFERGQVMQWLFFEQFSHEPNIATVRFWITELKKEQEYRDAIAKKRKLGYAALELMENHLSSRSFLVGENYSIADIGLFAYTHVAPEGGFDLSPYPAIQKWCDRVQSQPNYRPITQP